MTVHTPLPARRALLIGCALAGLAALPWRDRLEAQAFNANPKTVAGLVTYDRATPKVETITVESPTAIINWSPAAGTFLPNGNTATFSNGINNTDFVVLNRILSTQAIQFDGRVVSLLQDLAVGTSAPGGTVIFSSPGGIILGATAVFDVGSLVLTSLNVPDDGTGNFYDPAAQGLTFVQQGGTPPTSVVTLPGAQINAPAESSFVALVAPQVLHGGAITVNGSAAFIAGQQVQMRVNQGLFDIIIDGGTPFTVPLVHNGSTGGPASTGAADIHRIYLVARPVNQAITALLQGSIGFDPAVNAAVENGAIILSAGFSVAGGEVDRFGDFGPGPVPGLGASFSIVGGEVTSDLFGYAVTDMLASGTATGSLAFTQDVSLFAGRRAHLFAGGGQNVGVGGNVLVSAAQSRAADPTVFDFTGGEALIVANQGGTLAIAGNASIDASATGRVDVVQSRAGSGTGGTAGLFADGGNVQVAGSLRVLATGQGGQLDFFPDQGGAGTGGTAYVEGRNGGNVAVNGDLQINASGTASRSNGVVLNPAAAGTGGNISLAATGGGNVVVTGTATLVSNGTGGVVRDDAVVPGGLGRGGTVTILAAGNVTLTGDVTLSADGAGGDGPTDGNGRGGMLSLLTSAFPGPGGFLPGALNAGNVNGTASATGAPGTGNVPGIWELLAVGGGNINLVDLTLTAAADGTPPLPPLSTIRTGDGSTINVTQVATLTTPGLIFVQGTGTGRIVGGTYILNAGDDISVSHVGIAAGAFTMDVNQLFATSGDDFGLAAGAAVRGLAVADIRVPGVIEIRGRLVGRNILLGSSDVDITDTGAVGDAQTANVTLLVGAIVKPLPGQFTVLGGTTQGPGYTLTNAEGGRIRAGRLSIQVPVTGGTGPDLFVRDLILNGSGAANGLGALEILTPGTARVEGALSITNANATTAFIFLATNRLEVVTPAGSIRLRDAAGMPGGAADLSSNNLWIAPTAVIDRLRADPNYAGRDAELLLNTGVIEPRGYVEANGVVLRTGGTLFVQNSGQPLTSGFAGVTVGAGGLGVRGPDTAALANVTAFGRRLNADGSFQIGIPFFFQVNFQTPGVPLAADYTAGSAFNTCIIVTGQCAAPPDLQPQGPDPITGPTGGSSAIQLPGLSDEDDLVDTSFSADPLIEEPVTSGGESSLWECDRDGDGDCDDEDD